MKIHYLSRTITMIFTALALVITPLMTQPVSAREPDSKEKWGKLEVLSKGFVARRREPPKAYADTKTLRLVAKQTILKRNTFQTFEETDLALQSFDDESLSSGSVWLYTRGEGVFSIEIEEVADAMDTSPVYLRQLAVGKQLALTRGRKSDSATATKPVAWYFDEEYDALLFVAESYDTFHVDENAFRLMLNPSKSRFMQGNNGRIPANQVAPTAFTETLKFEQEPDFFYSLWTVKDEPDADYWFWDYLYGGYKDDITVALSIPAPAKSGTGQLRVLLRGWTDIEPGVEHHVYAELNGQMIGNTVSWDGFEAATLVAEFDQSLLVPDGNNTLRLYNEYTPGEHPGQWLDAIEVDYRRESVASDDQLWLHGLEKGLHTVSGFTSDDIVVIQNPSAAAARFRGNVRIDPDDYGGWAVTFKAIKRKPTDYLVVSRNAIQNARLEQDVASNLKSRYNSADYLIIASRELEQTAQALGAYRSGQSGLVKIAWLEDIYKQFNAGRQDPAAVTRFMKHVEDKWQLPPYFVTLIGKGSIDHKDRMGYADSYLPVSMTSTPWSLTVSDDRLLGGNGDTPFAIGRIPVTSEEEGLAYVMKVVAYETAEVNENPLNALLVADDPDEGGDFHTNTETLAEKLLAKSGFEQVTTLYHPDDDVRESFTASGSWETGYVSYDGHGLASQVGDFRENFITAEDAVLLENTARPIFTALTCAAGDDSQPGTRSLAGALVLNPTGGAIASFAPTGLSLDTDAQYLANIFVDQLFTDGQTIGVSAQQAKSQTNGFISGFMRRIYSVVGDPALYAR